MKFKAVQYEEYKWHSTIDTDMLSRRQRKTIVDKYNACLPCKIEKVNQNMKFEATDITDLVDEITSKDGMRRSK